MRKTQNEESKNGGTGREGLSPAVSSPEGSISEVHSGVGLVNHCL